MILSWPRCSWTFAHWRTATQHINTTISTATFSRHAHGLMAWCSGNAFHPINEVTLCQAGLVLGWVTACRQVNHLSM